MDLSFSGLGTTLLISIFGMALFLYGKNAQRPLPLIAGLAMGILEAFIAGLGSSDAKDVYFYAVLLLGLLVMGGVFARGRDRLNLGSSL